MTATAFLLPGALDQLTGGYLFDRHVIDGLRAMGREVSVIELPGRFPDADAIACTAAAQALASLANGSKAVIDGLALPAFADCLPAASKRLQLTGFIHHPLSLETGIGAVAAQHYAALEARLWPLLRGCICPGAQTAAAVIAAGVAAARVAVAPPGTARPASLPRKAPAETLQLLAVGSITPRKGHALLIDALATLRDLPWHLTCVGSLERDATTATALRAMINTHDLGARVTLAGELPANALATAYEQADVFVLPSYHEGYGMAYAEALAHGLPVIATNAGAIPDTVPADAALLVAPGDVAALRNALQRILTDAALRAQLAVGAARAGAALPDWPAAVRAWADAFDRINA